MGTFIKIPGFHSMLTHKHSATAAAIAQQFRDMIEHPSFPCVGAKSANAKGGLTIVHAHDITSSWNDIQIVAELLLWSQNQPNDKGALRSMVVIFEHPQTLTEPEFENAMWARLQSFADKDHWLGQSYDDSVSPNPEDPHFSLSFGGQAYFAVGLHPGASRPARRFAHPAIVFNLHAQFERLRAEGRFEKMRERIMERDTALAGSPNPMLANHGDASAANQFSGRTVGPDWVCPFRDPRETSEISENTTQ